MCLWPITVVLTTTRIQTRWYMYIDIPLSLTFLPFYSILECAQVPRSLSSYHSTLLAIQASSPDPSPTLSMEQLSREPRIILPKEPVTFSIASAQSSNSLIDHGTDHKSQGPNSSFTNRVRKARSLSKAEAEWARIQGPFHQLYLGQDMPLTDVMKRLEREYRFEAT